jgi:hypothetical protein
LAKFHHHKKKVNKLKKNAGKVEVTWDMSLCGIDNIMCNFDFSFANRVTDLMRIIGKKKTPNYNHQVQL